MAEELISDDWRDSFRAEARLQESLKRTGIPVLWNSEVREITGDEVVRAVKIEDKTTKTIKEIAVDGVFVGIGCIPNNDVAKQLKLVLDDQGYIRTDLTTMKTSMPHVYAAGDITGAPKQIVVAVAHGSMAAMTAFEELQEAQVRTGT